MIWKGKENNWFPFYLIRNHLISFFKDSTVEIFRSRKTVRQFVRNLMVLVSLCREPELSFLENISEGTLMIFSITS